jgi:hypothetical protein
MFLLTICLKAVVHGSLLCVVHSTTNIVLEALTDVWRRSTEVFEFVSSLRSDSHFVDASFTEFDTATRAISLKCLYCTTLELRIIEYDHHQA